MVAAEERETTIYFTDSDEDMQIATANRKLKSRLKKLGFEPEESEDGDDFYTVPRAFLQLRKPRSIDMTEEEKEERRERLREARKAAGIGEFASKKAKPKSKAKAKPEPEEVEDDDDEDEEEDVDFHDLAIAKLRAYAKEQGIASSGKTKKDLIAELEELLEDGGSEDAEDEYDEDDDEEEVEVVRPKAKSGSKAAKRKPTASARKRR